MAPDPPVDPHDGCLSYNHEIEDVVLGPHSSDDSDAEVEEQSAYDGYTLLAQHEVPEGEAEDQNEDAVIQEVPVFIHENDGNQTTMEQCPVPPSAGREEITKLWNATPTTTISMDEERSEQIKAAMANFCLPPSAVPPWAISIPEELWKQRLLDRASSTQNKL